MKNILIIGLGHIGGSLALGLKRKFKNVFNFYGIDISSRTLTKSHKKIGFLKKCLFGNKEEKLIIENSDIIFICVEPTSIEKIFTKISSFNVKKSVIVSDVASTKKDILKSARKIFKKKKINFVGGHPIAGTEKSGFSNSTPDLFEDKIYIQSGEIATKKQISVITNLWRKLGSKVYTIDVKSHDKVFAYLSHLPHVLSFCLNSLALKKIGKKRIDNLGGSSYKDYSRISSSSSLLWSDIFLSNSSNLIASLDESILFLEKLKLALKTNSRSKIANLIKP